MRPNNLFSQNFDRIQIFVGFLLVALNGAAVDVNNNFVKILVEQNVRPHLSASDATLVNRPLALLLKTELLVH